MMDNLFNICTWLGQQLHQIDQYDSGVLLVIQDAVQCYAAVYLARKLRSRGFGVSWYFAAAVPIITFRFLTFMACVKAVESRIPQGSKSRVEVTETGVPVLYFLVQSVTLLPFCHILGQLLDDIKSSTYLAITFVPTLLATWFAICLKEHVCFFVIMMSMKYASVVVSMFGGQVLDQVLDQDGPSAVQHGIPFLVIISFLIEHEVWSLTLRGITDPPRSIAYLATAVALGAVLNLIPSPAVLAQQIADQAAQPPIDEPLLPQVKFLSDQSTGGRPPCPIVRSPSKEAPYGHGRGGFRKGFRLT